MLRTEGIRKAFGTNQVLDGLDLDLKPGTVVGLLGNNGAGKSTLIHILLDLVPADAGFVEMMGMRYPKETQAIRRRIGVMPEEDLLHDELTAEEQLEFSCRLYGIPKAERHLRIRTLFDYFFDDARVLLQSCGSFSVGMRKKMGIIIALLHNPDLLILDEPFSGLDPAASQTLIRFLLRWMHPERGILVSSHNLNYVEQLANHVWVLHERRMVYDGSLAAFKERGEGLLDRTLFDLLNDRPKDDTGLAWLKR